MSDKRIIGGFFQIVSELSHGGFGQTFLAEDQRRADQPKCVVKLLKPQSDDPEVINLSKRLFAQEVKTLYQIGEHPQIPSIITHFEEDREFYFVQEYIEGNTFAEELAQGKIYTQRQTIEIIGDLLSVLAFVHRQGVIHRDVKPSNLICRRSDGKTVLIDFGAVKQVSSQQKQQPNQTTRGTIAIGSEGYMPMEQLAGHPRFSSDVYAVGMFAVQLLTQTHPTDLRQNQRTGEWIWQDRVTVNNHFAEFLNRMIRFDFRQRFTDAVEALNYLKRLNLNSAPVDRNVWTGHEFVANQPPRGVTQATFFSPVSVQNEPEHRRVDPPPVMNQPFPPPNNYLPQFEQTVRPIHPNLQKYNQPRYAPSQNAPNGAAVTRVETLPPLGPNNPVETSNVTLGALAFDGFRENTIPKPLIYVGVFLFLVALAIFSAYSAIGHERFESRFVQTKAPDRYNPNSGFMKNAMEKERDAFTSEAWAKVADEWRRGEEYYSQSEAQAATDEERENARLDKEYCYQKKLNALRLSASTRKK